MSHVLLYLQTARSKSDTDGTGNNSDKADQVDKEELMRVLAAVQVRRLTG
jgi:hypothetical protein